MILSIDVELALDKIQHHSMIKAQKKLGIAGMLFRIIKVICENPIANIILNGKN
jgi:hypothetical protein